MTTPSGNFLTYFHRLQSLQGQPAFDRRMVTFLGFVLGFLSGLVFGLVAHSINARNLPGVPWIEYPLGVWGNLLILVLFGSLAGWLCAAAQDLIEGVIKASLFMTLLFELYMFLTPYNTLRERLVLMLWGLAPLIVFTGVMVFYLAFIRWAVDKQIEFSEHPAWHWRRVLPLLSVLGVSALLGIFALAPGAHLQALKATHLLIQNGLAAPDLAGLPAALQAKKPPYPYVSNFLASATPAYTLEILRDVQLREELNAWPESPSSVVVLARFTDDWVITCQYDQPMDRVLACQDYAPGRVPQPGIGQFDQFWISLR